MYPIIGNPNGPMFEGWSTLVSWAENTSKIRIGLMVGANTFREPTITAKLATTLDHISNGRAILGVGAAWFEEEHEHFGLNFGDGFPERLRWLGEALPIMRGMLDGTEPTATGPRYKAKTVRNLPAPIQKRWRAGHAEARGQVRRREQRERHARAGRPQRRGAAQAL
jgi:alkanesulfonate monooxygenase SsuD/methylene tetrahydromethanopterin reductase-like flavin-dependent oxidoreductase (luciferase family)